MLGRQYLKTPACVCCLVFLFALSLAAQTNSLVVSTLAGVANYGTADGIHSAAKFLFPTGVAVDAGGNVYVTDTDANTIRKVSSSGTVSTFAGQAQVAGANDGTGTQALFDQPYGLAVDPAGNVYVADTTNCVIRKITPAGVVSLYAGLIGQHGFRDGPILVSGTNFPAFDCPFGIAIDKNTNIYVADTHNSLIRKIANGVVSTLAGDSIHLTTGTNDGAGTSARFTYPEGVAVDAAGNIYVADTGNSLVRFITPSGAVRTIAGNNGNGSFYYPSGIAVDALSNVYVSDTFDQLVQVLTPGGANWTAASYSYGQTNLVGDEDGIIGFSSTAFYDPWGLAVDSLGKIYIADAGNATIRKINPAASGALSTFAGPYESYGISIGVSNTLPFGRLNYPNGVAVDGAENIYVADTFNNCIRLISPQGTITIIAGSVDGDYGSADGTNTDAAFHSPHGICLDAGTNLYVADYGNATIRKITPDAIHSNWVVTTIAGQAGIEGESNGVGTNAIFGSLYGIAIDSASNLYVSDNANGQGYVRKITPSFVVTTLAGTNNEFKSATGIAVDGATNVYVADQVLNAIDVVNAHGIVSLDYVNGLNSPLGLAVDAASNLYIANSGDNTILGVNYFTEKPVLIAGTAGDPGCADGVGAAARFDVPIGLAVDRSTNIYIADALNNTIRIGKPYTSQTAVLGVDTYPSGMAVSIQGTNYGATPVVMALSKNASVTLITPQINQYVVTNDDLVTLTTNFVPFTAWTSNGLSLSASTDYNFTISTNETVVANDAPLFTVSPAASPASAGGALGLGQYASNSFVTLTAVTNNGFYFTGWTSNGVLVSASAVYTFVVTTNVSPVANFIPTYAVAATAQPGADGYVTGTGTFPSNTLVTLSAGTNNGFVFTNWTVNGVVVGLSTNLSFNVSSNVTAVANFIPTFTVAAGAFPLGGAAVAGAGTYPSNSVITVTEAVTNPLFAFTNWTVNSNVVALSNSYTFTLTTNISLVAQLIPTYFVTVQASPPSGGAVTPSGRFPSNSFITDIAGINPGYRFNGWQTPSGALETSTASYSFTLTNDVTNIAEFSLTPPQIQIWQTTNMVTNGQSQPINFGVGTPGVIGPNLTFVISNLGGQSLALNSLGLPDNFVLITNPPATITSFPTAIAGLTNGVLVVGFAPPAKGIFSGALALTNSDPTNGNFTFPLTAGSSSPEVITLLSFPSEGGTVSGGGIFGFGNTNTVVASPAGFYEFGDWTQNGIEVSTSTNYTFELDSNVTLVANFLAPYSYTVSASPPAGGTVTPGATAPRGSSNTVVAITNSGYIFSNWTLNGAVVATTNVYTFPLNGNDTLVANFTPITILSVLGLPSGAGTVSGGASNIIAGASRMLTAHPTSGYRFIGWTIDATGTQNPLTVTVNRNLTIAANFAINATNIYMLITTNGPGSVTPNENNKYLKPGSSFSLKAAPAAGAIFAGWTGSITSSKNPLAVTKLSTSLALQANFIQNPFVPFVGGYNGLFTANGEVAETNSGMLKGLNITSKGTYSASLAIDGVSKGFSGTFGFDGQASNVITLSKGNTVQVQLNLDSNGPLPQVTGTITGAGWQSTDLVADQATNEPNVLPSYTMLIAPDPSTPSGPSGYGYAVITGSPGKGRTLASAKIAGALADGTAFSESAPVSADGYVPVYANLYSSKGLLLGWINIDPANAGSFSLSWVHPPGKTGLFTASFASANQIYLSPWSNVPAGSLPTNLFVLEPEASPPVAGTYSFQYTKNGTTITATSTNAAGTLTGTLTAKTGVVKVTIGSGKTAITGTGVLLLDSTNGGGYLLNKTASGSVLFTP